MLFPPHIQASARHMRPCCAEVHPVRRRTTVRRTVNITRAVNAWRLTDRRDKTSDVLQHNSHNSADVHQEILTRASHASCKREPCSVQSCVIIYTCGQTSRKVDLDTVSVQIAVCIQPVIDTNMLLLDTHDISPTIYTPTKGSESWRRNCGKIHRQAYD